MLTELKDSEKDKSIIHLENALLQGGVTSGRLYVETLNFIIGCKSKIFNS
jgi:hypothetical protein